MFTSRRTSELIKYAANAFLATKITFINEMADLCEAVNANVQMCGAVVGLITALALNFYMRDRALAALLPQRYVSACKDCQEAGAPTQIVETVVRVNNERKVRMIEKLRKKLGGNVKVKPSPCLAKLSNLIADDMRDHQALCCCRS